MSLPLALLAEPKAVLPLGAKSLAALLEALGGSYEGPLAGLVEMLGEGANARTVGGYCKALRESRWGEYIKRPAGHMLVLLHSTKSSQAPENGAATWRKPAPGHGENQHVATAKTDVWRGEGGLVDFDENDRAEGRTTQPDEGRNERDDEREQGQAADTRNEVTPVGRGEAPNGPQEGAQSMAQARTTGPELQGVLASTSLTPQPPSQSGPVSEAGGGTVVEDASQAGPSATTPRGLTPGADNTERRARSGTWERPACGPERIGASEGQPSGPGARGSTPPERAEGTNGAERPTQEPAGVSASADGCPSPIPLPNGGAKETRDDGREHEARTHQTGADAGTAGAIGGHRGEDPRAASVAHGARGGGAPDPLTLTPTEPAKKRSTRAKGWDPTEVDLLVMGGLLELLHVCRAKAGWKRRSWEVAPSQCTELLRALRAHGKSWCEQAIRATCWLDARMTGDSATNAKCRAGDHANLPRIFAPTKHNKVTRWIEDWKDAGCPEPSKPRATIDKRGFVPRGEYTVL